MGGEWHTVRVADLGRVVTGRTPPGNDPRYYGENVPFLTPTDMAEHRQVERTNRSLSAFGANEMARCLVPHGVGVSCIGWQMGKAVLIERPTITNQQINTIVVNSDVADRSFVYYSLRARRAELFGLGAGGSRTPILNKGDFERLAFALPPIAEQRAIAHILGTLDDKIELNRRTNETLEAMARALFKSWFVDFDPVRAKAEDRKPSGMDEETAKLFPSEFVESEFGEVPRGWRWEELASAAELNPTRSLAKGVSAPYVEMSSLPTLGHRPSGWPPREAGSGARFRNGDTLLARITPCLENGKTGFVDFLEEGSVGWGSTEYIVIRPRDPLPTEWGYLLARDQAFRDFAAQKMEGTTGRQRVSSDALGRYLVVQPSAGVAIKFGDLVGALFRSMGARHSENQSLAGVRDALLPKLLSGELRVPARLIAATDGHDPA